jgi:hypothetical protein
LARLLAHHLAPQTIYNEGIQFGDQYFWDYTNPAAAEYFITSVVASLGDPAVDGTFTDDVGGLPEEHSSVMKRINMTPGQLKKLQEATTATHTKLVAALIKAGKYNWQAFSGGDGTGECWRLLEAKPVGLVLSDL